MIADIMKTTPTLPHIDENIRRVKQELMALSHFHPGSLSKQYQVCGKPGCKCCTGKPCSPHGPFFKLTYAFHGKYTCRFVRAESVQEVTRLVAAFKTFRRLTDQWIALAIQRGHLGPFQKTAAKPSKKPRQR